MRARIFVCKQYAGSLRFRNKILAKRGPAFCFMSQLLEEVNNLIQALAREGEAFEIRIKQKDPLSRDIADRIFEKRKERTDKLAKHYADKYGK